MIFVLRPPGKGLLKISCHMEQPWKVQGKAIIHFVKVRVVGSIKGLLSPFFPFSFSFSQPTVEVHIGPHPSQTGLLVEVLGQYCG
jgi:hypothetical protein